MTATSPSVTSTVLSIEDSGPSPIRKHRYGKVISFEQKVFVISLCKIICKEKSPASVLQASSSISEKTGLGVTLVQNILSVYLHIKEVRETLIKRVRKSTIDKVNSFV